MLICDGHDSHVTANFIGHCINNDIVLLILSPHTSHLLQLLDVGVFGVLKTAMSRQVDRLIRLGISRLSKSEWTECYVEARELAFTTANITGSWYGAGLIPFNKVKVFHHLPPCTSPSIASSTSVAPFNFELITSSLPNAISLHLNTALNELINSQQPLNSPAHKYVG